MDLKPEPRNSVGDSKKSSSTSSSTSPLSSSQTLSGQNALSAGVSGASAATSPPPATSARRSSTHSSVSGGRSRGGQFDDEYMRRRERNNAAVRRSRDKAKRRLEETLRRVKKLQQENEQLQRALDSVVQELHLLHGLYDKLGAPVPESLTRFLTELQAQPIGSTQSSNGASASASLQPVAVAAWAASVSANGGVSSHHLLPAAGASASGSAAINEGGLMHAVGDNSMGSESDSPSHSSDSPQSAGGLYQQPVATAAAAPALGGLRSVSLLPLEALSASHHPPHA